MSGTAGSLVIYDGTFGPAHQGHCDVVQALTQVEALPRPIKVVVNVAGDVGKPGAWKAQQRLPVAQAAFSPWRETVVVSDFYITVGEREKRYVSTAEAVEHLRSTYSGFRIYLSGGLDNFDDQHFRKKHPNAVKKIVEMYDGFIVFPRGGQSCDNHALTETLLSIVDGDEHACANVRRLHMVPIIGFTDRGLSSTLLKKILFFVWALQKLPEEDRSACCPDYKDLRDCCVEMLTPEICDVIMPNGLVKDEYGAASSMTAMSQDVHEIIQKFQQRAFPFVEANGEPPAKRSRDG